MNRSADTDRRIVGLFAKQPIVGSAKTRLAQATGSDWALRVAQAFLEDSLDRVSQVDATRAIVFAPSSAASYFFQFSQDRFELIPQGEGNLGERLEHFFTDSRQQGFSRIIAIGSDSPTLPIPFIEQAFQLLVNHDVVIGPATDGGYYLVGCGVKQYPLFADIPWSTSGVLESTVRRLNEASARIALLPPWYDVDTLDDWTMLCGHVLAMRQAGIDPGVPRVERLIREQIT